MLTPAVGNTGITRGRQIGGRSTVDVAGSSNILLTSAHLMLEVLTYTGLLTGSITVTLPLDAEATGHGWLIDNQSTGAFEITTAGPNGVGVKVPQGRKQRLGWNGATIFTADDGHLSHETVSIAQTTTTDRTLTNAQYKCGHLVCTGSPGGAFNWIVPTSPGLYVIENASDQALTLKTSAGSGIVVAAGKAASLRCNGVDVRRVSPDVDPAA